MPGGDQAMPPMPGRPPVAVQQIPMPQQPVQPAPILDPGFQRMPNRPPVSMQPQPQPLQPQQLARPAAPTHLDFANTFQPMPGQYQVLVLHPFTLQPVTVTFRLPPSKGPYKTRVTARYVEFDSPDHTVDIRFARDGRVFVDQD
jgi:hypothetical protein